MARAAQADSFAGGGQFACEVRGGGFFREAMGCGDYGKNALCREGVRRSLSDAPADHRITAFENAREAGVVATPIAAAFADASTYDLALEHIENQKSGAPRQVIAHGNAVRGSNRKSHEQLIVTAFTRGCGRRI